MILDQFEYAVGLSDKRCDVEEWSGWVFGVPYVLELGDRCRGLKIYAPVQNLHSAVMPVQKHDAELHWDLWDTCI